LKRKLFLIHWKSGEAMELARPLRMAGWEVEIEAEGGARAGRRVRSFQPDVVVIYLDRLPSHGRQTARYLRSRLETRDMPVIFVNGAQKPLEEIKALLPEAAYTASERLESVLKELSCG
jgi:DNA-binding response OmpR family regulator